ncbi:MAG TPA: roadblock/LC7 domain-containing protein [Blastocatellia bacterium]|nr:roadblock/LC7 domain-containing protein [Blastocatellia bacterium]
MDLKQPLVDLVSRVDGAFGAILADREGEEVSSYTLPGRTERAESAGPERLKLIGAYQIINLNTCQEMMQQFQLGSVKQMICRYEKATVLIRSLGGDYALILAMENDGNVGKGIFYLNQAAEVISQDL